MRLWRFRQRCRRRRRRVRGGSLTRLRCPRGASRSWATAAPHARERARHQTARLSHQQLRPRRWRHIQRRERAPLWMHRRSLCPPPLLLQQLLWGTLSPPPPVRPPHLSCPLRSPSCQSPTQTKQERHPHQRRRRRREQQRQQQRRRRSLLRRMFLALRSPRRDRRVHGTMNPAPRRRPWNPRSRRGSGNPPPTLQRRRRRVLPRHPCAHRVRLIALPPPRRNPQRRRWLSPRQQLRRRRRLVQTLRGDRRHRCRRA